MSTITSLDPTAPQAQPAREGAKRIRKVLVKKVKPPFPLKEYIWLAGHLMTFVFGLIYLIFYFFKYLLPRYYYFPRICYRLSFVGVLLSYSITVITTFGTNLPDYQTLLATENFQNLVLAVPWLLSRPSAFKLFPYFFVTNLQLASHYKVPGLLKFQNQISDIVALSEFVVIFALLFDTLLFKAGSGFALAIYLGFYWLRLNFSPYTQVFFLKIVNFIDTKVMAKQKPEVQAKWKKIKDFVEFRRSQAKEQYNIDSVTTKEKTPRSSEPSKPIQSTNNGSRAPSVSSITPKKRAGLISRVSTQTKIPFVRRKTRNSLDEAEKPAKSAMPPVPVNK